MSEQITTLTFFRYSNFNSKIWAFGMMQFAKKPLKKTKGLTFYKLLGSGKKYFDPKPDWGVYGLLQVWENEQSANSFFESNSLAKKYESKCSEAITFYMKNIKAHGLWSKNKPFKKSSTIDENNTYVAIVTRATIKLKFLKKFWNYVPSSQKDLICNKDLLFSAGVGEHPITQMATFSIWNTVEAAKKFAYSSTRHKFAVEQTRTLNWYKEEMFTRFQPYRISGSWKGFELPEYFK